MYSFNVAFQGSLLYVGFVSDLWVVIVLEMVDQ